MTALIKEPFTDGVIFITIIISNAVLLVQISRVMMEMISRHKKIKSSLKHFRTARIETAVTNTIIILLLTYIPLWHKLFAVFFCTKHLVPKFQ